MARPMKLTVGALNIRLHPHSPELYDQFLQALYELKQPIRLRGDRYGMITLINRRGIDEGVIRGTIRTFTKIDLRGQWFDQEKLDDAAPDLLREISIPPNVHPNSSAFRFSLNVNSHLLTFEHYTSGRYLVARAAYTLFRQLSDQPAIIREFGPVKISIVQDRTSLDRIFNMTRITRLTFILDRPNPDIWSDDIEGQVDAHLAAVHAERVAVTYVAPPGDSLVETPSLRRLGNSALRNGEVEGRGYEGRSHVKVSTLDSPRIDQTTYDPEAESEAQAFERLRRGMEGDAA